MVAGFLLALTVSFFCYRQQYKSLLGSESGELALEMNEFGEKVLPKLSSSTVKALQRTQILNCNLATSCVLKCVVC